MDEGEEPMEEAPDDDDEIAEVDLGPTDSAALVTSIERAASAAPANYWPPEL